MAGVAGRSGRQPSWKEEEILKQLKDSLRKLYTTEAEDEATSKLIMDVAQTESGKLWILRRLLGDPRKAVDLNTDTDSPINIHISYDAKPNDPDLPETGSGDNGEIRSNSGWPQDGEDV